MKKILHRTAPMIAAALAVIIAFSGANLNAFAEDSATAAKDGATAADTSAETDDASVSDDEKADENTDENTKDEMVYVLSDANGAIKKVIVSDWLRNGKGDATLDDVSSLKDIENVAGDETFTQNGNSLIWSADGGDIKYQGTTDAKPPVTVSVSYQLDGKDISADDIAGKSGRVTIRFDYENEQYEMKQIGGKDTKIYVPFVMLTGFMMDNESISNVEVSNGRMMNDGDRTYVMGFAVPGLKEDLGIADGEKLSDSLDVSDEIKEKIDDKVDKAEDDIDLPEYVEVSFDATDFKLDTTVTLASNSMFGNFDFDGIDGLDDLGDDMDELTSAMNKLIDGSSDLYDGLQTLLDRSGELVDGIDELAAALPDVYKLETGSAELADGLDEISSNSSTLVSGARQTFESLLSMADEQLEAAGVSAQKLTIGNYASVLSGIASSLNKTDIYNMAYKTAYSKVEATVRANEAAVREQVTEAVKAKVGESVRAAVFAQMGITEETYPQLDDATKAQVDGAIEQTTEAQMASTEVQATIDQNTEATIQSLIDDNMNSATVQDQINTAVSEAMAGAGSIAELKSSLDDYNKFYEGVIEYTDAVDSAASGAGEVADGVKKLYDSLSAGVPKMQSGAKELIDGETKLRDGAGDMRDGINELNEKGIKKLVDMFDGDYSALSDRLKAISEVAKDYNTFTGVSDDMDGSVRFFYRTDSIGE